MKTVGDQRARVGESPFWSAHEQALYWSDLRGQAVKRLDWTTGEQRSFEFDRPVAAPAPLKCGGYAALLADGLWTSTVKGWQFRGAPAGHDARHRFNDATIDPAGRLLAGTMVERGFEPAPTGILYSFGSDGWKPLLGGFWTINGLAVSPDGRTIYVSDSHPSVSTVWCADYDVARGRIGPRRLFAHLPPSEGRPDGAAVDTEGCYWVAAIGGGRVLRYRPSGELDRVVPTPSRFPTKPAFGGPDLRTLFVTSLQPPVDVDPLDGALFRLQAAVAGAVIPALDVEGL